MKALFFLIILLINTSSLYANENLAENYHWFDSKLGSSKFLVPNGWFTKEEYGKGHYALFITKEKITSEQTFNTGLTLNFNTHISRKAKVMPSKYALSLISLLIQEKSTHIITKPWKYKKGENLNIGVTFVNQENITIAYQLIANDQKDTLYVILFESPNDQWDNNWTLGRSIIQHLRIDSHL